MADKTAEAKKMVNEVKAHPKLDTASRIYLAQACSVMGEKSEAFEFLEAAYKERASLLIYIGVKPAYENIRSDPRYADLLRRMGLPQVPLPNQS